MGGSIKLFLGAGAFFLCLFFGQEIEKKISSLSLSPQNSASKNHSLATLWTEYHFGFQAFLGHWYWVQFLQKYDENPKSILAKQTCSWEADQLDRVVTLVPRMRLAYRFGVHYLTYVKQDECGAQKLMKKWTTHEPRYWYSWYYLSFYEYRKKQNFVKASEFMLKASQLPQAPYWLTALGVRLLTESRSLEHAIKVSYELLNTMGSWKAKKRLMSRITHMEVEKERLYLASGLDEFRKKFLREPHSHEELLKTIKKELKFHIHKYFPEKQSIETTVKEFEQPIGIYEQG